MTEAEWLACEDPSKRMAFEMPVGEVMMRGPVKRIVQILDRRPSRGSRSRNRVVSEPPCVGRRVPGRDTKCR
jgi:hypothetical protein